MNSFLDKIFHKLRFKKILKYIPKDSFVFDIGCGEKADFLRSISPLVKKGIGLDGKVENYKDAKLELKKFRIQKELPIQDESCDVVLMMAVLEHLSFPQEALNECFRCLKKEGKMIITVPAPSARPILEFLAFKLKLIDRNEVSDHKNYFRPKDLKQMLAIAGFNKDKIESRFFEFRFNILIVASK